MNDSPESSLQWLPFQGQWNVDASGEAITFQGSPLAYGIALANRSIKTGTIAVTATIHSEGIAQEHVVSDTQAIPEKSAQIVVGFEPASRSFLSVGLGGGALCSVYFFSQATTWTLLNAYGEASNLEIGRPYSLRLVLQGQVVSLFVDDISAIRHQLAIPLVFGTQSGVMAQGERKVTFQDFMVQPVRPRGFAVMEFSEKFNALYKEVLQPVSQRNGIDLIRADEIPGPGFIIADIVRNIYESSLIVAEITHTNPNVYFEIGYAYASGKPLILLAERGHQLPFDVAGMRVIFYDDSIGGKSQVESEFSSHLQSLLAR